MNVLLIKYTTDPDKTVALAARRCYSSLSAQEIEEKLSKDEIEKLINKLRMRNHLSPFEHISFTFSVDGVSRALSHQLIRHRIASYCQESQRYVEYKSFTNLPYIIPQTITLNSDAFNLFTKTAEDTLVCYKKLLELGIPPEDARYIFPNAIETKLIFTMNARSLFNFFEQRCCLKAQWEIRQLAYKMLSLVREVAPLTFKNAGAPCCYESNTYCRENDPSCRLYPKKT